MPRSKVPKAELETHRLISFAGSVASSLLSIPLKWDSAEHLVKPISVPAHFLFQFVAFFDFVNRSCRSLTYAWCLYQDSLSINQVVWGAILFVTFLMTYTIQINMIIKYKEFIAWINVFIRLGTKLERILKYNRKN